MSRVLLGVALGGALAVAVGWAYRRYWRYDGWR